MMEETEGYQNGEQFSQEVLDTLAQENLSATDELHFAFYLYLSSESKATECCVLITEAAYGCEIEEIEEGLWLCCVTSYLIPSSENLQKIGNILADLAEKYHGDFDGWEIVLDDQLELPSDIDFSVIAQNILESVKSNCQLNHEYRIVQLADFADLDGNFYTEIQSELEHLGFELLVDIEDQTISSLGDISTLIRTMWHPQTKVVAAFYDIPALNSGTIDLESFFSNNEFVVSTTGAAQNQISESPMIKMNYHPDLENVETLYQRHLASIENVVSASQNIQAIEVNTFDKIVEIQNLQVRLKYEHLESIGWVTQEYLLNQSGGNEQLAKQVFDAVQKLL